MSELRYMTKINKFTYVMDILNFESMYSYSASESN